MQSAGFCALQSFFEVPKGREEFTTKFTNTGKNTVSKNEKLSETYSAVYSLSTMDHFLHSVRVIKNALFGQDDRLHNLNIK